MARMWGGPSFCSTKPLNRGRREDSQSLVAQMWLALGLAGSKEWPRSRAGPSRVKEGMPFSRGQGAIGSLRWRGFSVAAVRGTRHVYRR